ncbi:MAG: hypothetical protein QOI23_2063 [Chloroflexota bacterium]|nr:hypothetical protein [Chloroflexota bacterium]
MNESRFRNLLSEAIGNEPSPPWLATSVRSRLLAPPQQSRPTHLMVAVATVAVLLGGVVGMQWLAAGRAPVVGPAATPSASPSPNVVMVDPTNCRLPVMVERGAGPPSQLSVQVGFINTMTGHYTRDAAPSLAGLPRSPSYGVPSGAPAAIFYSPAVKRWLPIAQGDLAPDGRSYLWIRTLPVGVPYPKYTKSELHRFDVASATDRLLWTYAGDFAVQRWDANGILVDGGPVRSQSPTVSWWIIDPTSGKAVRTSGPKYTFPAVKPLPGDPKNWTLGTVGFDAYGHTVWQMEDRDKPGTLDWVFYETSPGQRVTIYRGQSGFNPRQALTDSTGVWLDNFDTQAIFHWQRDTGLHKVDITGLPSRLPGANSYIDVTPKGACF